jgi:CheY-like chemotaxis protein
LRVLVVEDDGKIASFVINGLKQAGFTTNHAADGEEALRLALSEHYDVAVVDVMLPKLDGLSLIEELRRQSIPTPVIILSASFLFVLAYVLLSSSVRKKDREEFRQKLGEYAHKGRIEVASEPGVGSHLFPPLPARRRTGRPHHP